MSRSTDSSDAINSSNPPYSFTTVSDTFAHNSSGPTSTILSEMFSDSSSSPSCQCLDINSATCCCSLSESPQASFEAVHERSVREETSRSTALEASQVGGRNGRSRRLSACDSQCELDLCDCESDDVCDCESDDECDCESEDECDCMESSHYFGGTSGSPGQCRSDSCLIRDKVNSLRSRLLGSPVLIYLHSISLQMELLLPRPAYPVILEFRRERIRPPTEPGTGDEFGFVWRCEFCGKRIEMIPTFGMHPGIDSKLQFCCERFRNYVESITRLIKATEEEEAMRAAWERRNQRGKDQESWRNVGRQYKGKKEQEREREKELEAEKKSDREKKKNEREDKRREREEERRREREEKRREREEERRREREERKRDQEEERRRRRRESRGSEESFGSRRANKRKRGDYDTCSLRSRGDKDSARGLKRSERRSSERSPRSSKIKGRYNTRLLTTNLSETQTDGEFEKWSKALRDIRDLRAGKRKGKARKQRDRAYTLEDYFMCLLRNRREINFALDELWAEAESMGDWDQYLHKRWWAEHRRQRHQVTCDTLYDADHTFILIFPDGSGNVYYSSGNLAIVIYSLKTERYSYVVLDDKQTNPAILACFNEEGFGFCHFGDGNVRLTYSQIGGLLLARGGDIRQTWAWKRDDLSEVFHPVCFGLNAPIGIRIMGPEDMTLSFREKQHFCKFFLDTHVLKVTIKPNEELTEKDEYLEFLKEARVKIRQLLKIMEKMTSYNRSKVIPTLPPIQRSQPVTAKPRRPSVPKKQRVSKRHIFHNIGL